MRIDIDGHSQDQIQELVDLFTKAPSSFRLLRWALERVGEELGHGDYTLSADDFVVLVEARAIIDRAVGGLLTRLDTLRNDDRSVPPATRAA